MPATDPPINITDVAAVVVACLALFVSAWSVYSTHRHNRLSVRPSLAIHRYFDQDDWSGLYISNLGLGPAITESFELIVNGQPALDWNHALTQAGLGDEFRDLLSTRSFRAGNVVATEDSMFLLRLDGKAKDYRALGGELQTALTRLRIRIKYRSMYDERCTLEWP